MQTKYSHFHVVSLKSPNWNAVPKWVGTDPRNPETIWDKGSGSRLAHTWGVGTPNGNQSQSRFQFQYQRRGSTGPNLSWNLGNTQSWTLLQKQQRPSANDQPQGRPKGTSWPNAQGSPTTTLGLYKEESLLIFYHSWIYNLSTPSLLNYSSSKELVTNLPFDLA